MPAIANVLVVGGGTAGAAAAIGLAEAGVTVDLVEITPMVSALGSGLTLQGNALRVLEQLGIWPDVAKAGFGFDTLGLRAPDPAGTLLAELDDVRSGGTHLPATVGIYRPELARLLIDRAREVGAEVRHGWTVRELQQQPDGVRVTFDSGASSRYDLVVGADGIRSSVRELIGIDVTPRQLGMGIWRAFTPRPASVTRTDLCYGGPCYIAGYCPTGPDSMYCYLVEPAQDRAGLSAAERLAVMRELSRAYHGPWDDIRPLLDDASRVNYTQFETHLLPAPWNRGRVVLIGDAAHSCPPTLAQGAALALEDAAVLAELLIAAARVDGALWDAFTARRFDRTKVVVDGSNQLAQWLIDHERGDVPGLMGRVMSVVSRPA